MTINELIESGKKYRSILLLTSLNMGEPVPFYQKNNRKLVHEAKKLAIPKKNILLLEATNALRCFRTFA